MKRYYSKHFGEYYITNDFSNVADEDYTDGAILYAQEKTFGKGIYVIDKKGKPIGDENLLAEIRTKKLSKVG